MRTSRFDLPGSLKVALSVSIVGAVGLLALKVSPDAVLARGYGKALAVSETSWSSPVAPENIWLSKSVDQPQALRRPVALGDRITISGQDGRPEVIEVVALEQIDGGGIGAARVQFQLVTGRLEAQPAGGAVIRFLFAVDAPGTATAAPKPDKVL